MRRAVLLFFLSFLAPLAAEAAAPSYDPKLLGQMPEYCVHVNEIRGRLPFTAGYEEWRRYLGNDVIHMHHYCEAFIAWITAKKTPDRKGRNQFLHDAAANFNYMLVQTSPEFKLRPEVHTQLGKVMIELDQKGDAVRNFMKAIEIKPDYAPAYMALADLHRSMGQDAEAKKVVQAGLGQAPKSKGLLRRLRELGGASPSGKDNSDKVGSSQ